MAPGLESLPSTCHQPPNTRPCSPSLVSMANPWAAPGSSPGLTASSMNPDGQKVGLHWLSGSSPRPSAWRAGPSVLWLGVPLQPPLPQTPPHPPTQHPALRFHLHPSWRPVDTEASVIPHPKQRRPGGCWPLPPPLAPGGTARALGGHSGCWRFGDKNHRKPNAEVPCPPGTCCLAGPCPRLCAWLPRMSHHGERFPPGRRRVRELS